MTGWGDAVSACSRESRCSVSTIASAPAAASLSCSVPAVSRGAIGTSTTSTIGPVSSPASICMIVIAVASSPAAIARWIGAAPRQRGNLEAWMLRHP